MENNKLIAEFMGYKLAKCNNGLAWDWLMPVVQKIEQDCEGVPQEMINISLYSDINEVYEAVVEFIKNQNK